MSKIKKYLNEVYLKPESRKLFSSSENLLSDKLRIELIGQKPERAYNDRDVFIKIELSMNEIQTWIKAEEAIELGKLLIESGNESLEFNRKQAYEIIEILAAKNGVNNGKYSRLIITNNREDIPYDYGEGYKYYDFLYVSNDDDMSRLIKDVVVNWSPFEDEFDRQLNYYSDGLPVDMINWSYQEIKDKFDKQMEEFENNM